MWYFEDKVKAAWKDADAWIKDFGGSIAAQWNEDLSGIAFRCKTRDVSDLLTNRNMFPSIPLIHWVADAVEWKNDSIISELSTGAFLAYMFIRFQDDVMDGQAESAGGLLVGNVCLEGFHLRYGNIFKPDHDFWNLWRDLMQRYSETTLWEFRKRSESKRVFSTSDLERLGEKFVLAAAPAAAVAYLGGETGLIGPIVELTESLGRGLQLVNDHMGLAHDFETSNYTAVINDILLGVPDIRGIEEAVFPRRALVTDALERNLRRSRIFFRCAATIAHDNRIPYVADYAAEHEAYLEEEIHRLADLRDRARAMDEKESFSAECLNDCRPAILREVTPAG